MLTQISCFRFVSKLNYRAYSIKFYRDLKYLTMKVKIRPQKIMESKHLHS